MQRIDPDSLNKVTSYCDTITVYMLAITNRHHKNKFYSDFLAGRMYQLCNMKAKYAVARYKKFAKKYKNQSYSYSEQQLVNLNFIDKLLLIQSYTTEPTNHAWLYTDKLNKCQFYVGRVFQYLLYVGHKKHTIKDLLKIMPDMLISMAEQHKNQSINVMKQKLADKLLWKTFDVHHKYAEKYDCKWTVGQYSCKCGASDYGLEFDISGKGLDKKITPFAEKQDS
jgi:hypothetical protein